MSSYSRCRTWHLVCMQNPISVIFSMKLFHIYCWNHIFNFHMKRLKRTLHKVHIKSDCLIRWGKNIWHITWLVTIFFPEGTSGSVHSKRTSVSETDAITISGTLRAKLPAFLQISKYNKCGWLWRKTRLYWKTLTFGVTKNTSNITFSLRTKTREFHCFSIKETAGNQFLIGQVNGQCSPWPCVEIIGIWWAIHEKSPVFWSTLESFSSWHPPFPQLSCGLPDRTVFFYRDIHIPNIHVTPWKT